MPPLLCTGRDQVEATFEYSFEKDQFEETWHFRVQTIPTQPDREAFDLSVTALADATVWQVMLAHHNNPAYIAMGNGFPTRDGAAGDRIFRRSVNSQPIWAQKSMMARVEALNKELAAVQSGKFEVLDGPKAEEGSLSPPASSSGRMVAQLITSRI